MPGRLRRCHLLLPVYRPVLRTERCQRVTQAVSPSQPPRASLLGVRIVWIGRLFRCADCRRRASPPVRMWSHAPTPQKPAISSRKPSKRLEGKSAQPVLRLSRKTHRRPTSKTGHSDFPLLFNGLMPIFSQKRSNRPPRCGPFGHTWGESPTGLAGGLLGPKGSRGHRSQERRQRPPQCPQSPNPAYLIAGSIYGVGFGSTFHV